MPRATEAFVCFCLLGKVVKVQAFGNIRRRL